MKPFIFKHFYRELQVRGIFLVYETRKIFCPIDFITDFIFFIFNADLYAFLSILLGLLKNSTGYS